MIPPDDMDTDSSVQLTFNRTDDKTLAYTTGMGGDIPHRTCKWGIECRPCFNVSQTVRIV
jgi:hypothetical protein